MLAAEHSPLHGETRTLFNHDIMSCTHEEVAGNHLYSGRVLGMTEPGDLIQLHPFLRRDWPAIQAHYERIGLAHASDVIWDVSPERLNDHPEFEPSVFFFGPGENKVVRDHRWQRVVEHVNDKNNFIALASHLRLPVPNTRCFHGREWFAGIEHFPYPCYLKPAISVAGKGIHRCEDQEQLIQALAHFEEGIPLQVQDEVDAVSFLNLQYRATSQGVERLLASEQVLKGYTHQGNRYPTRYDAWSAVEPMAQWLWERGMRGLFAFDVAVLETKQGPEYVAIECNPRFNGASYPSGVALKLGLESWLAKDFATQYDRLDEIDLSGLEYDPATGQGVIIVNWGTIMVRKLGLLLVGDHKTQADLEQALIARL